MESKGKSAVSNECYFARLPVELLARIASYTNASTILTLARTSRTLRAASYDALVFKQIIQHSQRDVWELPCLNLETLSSCAGDDVQIWGRYAVADEKAIAFVRGQTPDTDQVESLRWAPQLAILQHPFLYSTRPKTPRLELFSRKPRDGESLYKATAFLIPGLEVFRKPTHEELLYQVIAFLTNPENIPDHKHEFRSELSSLGRNDTDFSIAQSYSILADIMTCWNNDRWNREAAETSARRPFNRDLAVIPTMNDLGLFSSKWDQKFPPPLHRETSAPDLLDHHNQWQAWSRNHSQNAFMSASTWRGFYTYTSPRNAGIATLKDPMMRGISFQITNSTASDVSSCLEVEARDGFDGHGRFDIRGKMDWTSQSFVGTKTYTSGNVSGVTWNWDLKISPLGLHGYYYCPPPRSSSPCGYVWLWRDNDLQC